MAAIKMLEPDKMTVFAEMFAEIVEAQGDAAGTDTAQSWTSDSDA